MPLKTKKHFPENRGRRDLRLPLSRRRPRRQFPPPLTIFFFYSSLLVPFAGNWKQIDSKSNFAHNKKSAPQDESARSSGRSSHYSPDDIFLFFFFNFPGLQQRNAITKADTQPVPGQAAEGQQQFGKKSPEHSLGTISWAEQRPWLKHNFFKI